MRIKSYLSIVLISTLFFTSTSCKKEGCTDETAINFDAEAEDDDGSDNTNSNNSNNLPETYIVFDLDTFYQSGTSISPGQTAYRYQVNLSSKEQLDLQGNYGNTEATIGLGITFKEKPTTSGTAYFSKSRFPGETSDSVNFYMSMFVNIGHEYEGENFLSPSTEKIDYTIENGVFSATIPTLEMILESDQTTKVTLNSGVLELDW